ncbi:MAG: hydroxymethylpyrimidine/phosphomethylpyrimidine kinase [Lentimonas sp.]|jgi:hydroxymethylpyrimidine/phosphomethylpyrimidine kinase
MAKLRPYCLSIAGFDPSGGAGIVADCKTFEQHKTIGLSVQTANTFQTENHFLKADWIDEKSIIEQMDLLLKRYPVKYFKIGLIESETVLIKILTKIKIHVANPVIIWDPILSASAGGNWNTERFQKVVSSDILKGLIITPNLNEFDSLGLLENIQSSTIYLKGGHAVQKGKDLLYHQGKTIVFNSKIITDLKKHGTGCIFSSALLSNLARENNLQKSCLKAKRYIEKRIVSNESLLSYHK